MGADGFIDWNKFTLDQHCEILENEFRFSSSGIAKSVFELIEFYKRHKPSGGKKKPNTKSKCNKHDVIKSVCGSTQADPEAWCWSCKVKHKCELYKQAVL
jgi:hypothetical protein